MGSAWFITDFAEGFWQAADQLPGDQTTNNTLVQQPAWVPRGESRTWLGRNPGPALLAAMLWQDLVLASPQALPCLETSGTSQGPCGRFPALCAESPRCTYQRRTQIPSILPIHLCICAVKRLTRPGVCGFPSFSIACEIPPQQAARLQDSLSCVCADPLHPTHLSVHCCRWSRRATAGHLFQGAHGHLHWDLQQH